jgi:hypothetical protein
MQEHLLATKNLAAITLDDDCGLNASARKGNWKRNLWLSTEVSQDCYLFCCVTSLEAFALSI